MVSPDTIDGIRKTKIVCTLGYTSQSEAVIRRMIQNGMNVARLNFSHGEYDWHKDVLDTVRVESEKLSMPVGIMVDVPGPKFRTGDTEPVRIDLDEGDTISLTSRDIIGNESVIPVVPPGIHLGTEVYNKVLINDGMIELRIVSIDGEDLQCRVTEGGRIERTGRGVVIPDVMPSLPFFNEGAHEALTFAAEQDVEYIAISNVSSGEDIENARKILHDNGGSHDSMLVAKIERKDAIDNFDDILEASDGIMVARGDMGVEIDPWLVPGIQKRLIAKCNAVGKPVITATQMLLSMTDNQRATRAESSDVYNAVLDGSDAVMLSEETAAGRHPAHVVRTMAQLSIEAERAPEFDDLTARRELIDESRTDDAVSFAAVEIANRLDASAIVAFTESGSTASRVSRYRPKAPILALTPYQRVCRLLTLKWGVKPVAVRKLESGDDFFGEGETVARKEGGVETGKSIVLVAGLPMATQGRTNLIHVMSVGGV